MKKTIWIIAVSAFSLVFACWALAGTARHWFRPVPVAAPLPDAKLELEKLYARYARTDDGLSIKGTIHLYDEEQNNALKETSSFLLVKKGDQWYNQLGYMQTFVQGDLVVELDTLNKYIVVSRLLPETLSGARSQVLLPEGLFSDTARFKLTVRVTAAGNSRTLYLQSDFNPDIKSCSITYDTASYRASHAVIAWWKNGAMGDTAVHQVWRTEIDYSYQPFSEPTVPERISEVITFRDHQPVVTARYKDYELHTRF